MVLFTKTVNNQLTFVSGVRNPIIPIFRPPLSTTMDGWIKPSISGSKLTSMFVQITGNVMFFRKGT